MMSAPLLERPPRGEALSDPFVDAWEVPPRRDGPLALNRPVRFTERAVLSPSVPGPAESICIVRAPLPASALAFLPDITRWLDPLRGPGGLALVALAVTFVLTGLIWARIPADQSHESTEAPVSPPPVSAEPHPFGPGFSTYRGLGDQPIRFVSNRASERVAAVPGALLLDWQEGQPQAALRLQFGNSPVEPEGDLPGQTDDVVATIRYRSVWPGIDMVVRTTPTGLAFDLVVQPGADPSAIELTYPDATVLSIESDGRLRGQGPDDGWLDGAPESWQDGPAGRTPVSTRFELRGGTRFGFVVGPFDPTRPLMVNPPIEPAE